MSLPDLLPISIKNERKTALFMWGALLVLLLLVILIAFRQDYFVRKTTVYFFAPNAQGLSKGMAVKFIGFKVGSVRSVAMQPNATVKVQLALDNDYVPLIGRDAKARLTKEALVGESVVEIIPGEAQVEQIAQNSVLAFERGQDAGSLAESLAAQVQPILAEVRQITSSINNPRGDVQQILKNLNQVTAGLKETVSEFNALAKNGNQKLDALHVKADVALDRVNHSLALFDQALPKLINQAETTLDNVQAATLDIRQATTASSRQVPALLHNTNALVEDSQATLKGVQRSWLLNDLFPAPRESALPVDSYVPASPAKP
ncbi:MAG: hypothetical protein Fur0040_12890 [Sideroxydans sp.]